MRVLAAIVVPPHLSVSGAARAAEDLSRALAGRCTMSVASMLDAGKPGADASNMSDEGPERGGAVRRVPVRAFLPPGLGHRAVPRRFKTLFYRSDIPDTVRRGGYDLVHIHNPMPALEVARIARACREAGIPYVVSTHGFNEVANGLRIYGFGPLGRAVWRRLVLAPMREVVANAAEIYALSPADLPCIAALGRPAGRTRIVANGVALPPEGASEGDEALLSKLGIAPRGPSAPPMLLFLANHTPNKGLPVLFEAASRLRRDFQLVVGGERRPNVDYERAVAACRPGQRVLVTGRLSDAEVAACFRRADAFVFPTLADTFPLVVLEAMAHGVAVVASAVGGIPHQLADGCGLLVGAGDAEALAGTLERLLDEPGLRDRLGRSGRRRVAEHYSWDRVAEAALEGYAQLLRCAVASPSELSPWPLHATKRRAF